MATHFSILAWRIPYRGAGGLLSVGLHRIQHDWSDLACMHSALGLALLQFRYPLFSPPFRIFLLVYLAVPSLSCSMWDLSSLTKS